MVNVAEETKNPSRTMPLAILFIYVPAAIPYLGVLLCLGTVVLQPFNW